MGADGYIPSLAPLFPKAHLNLYEYGRKGDIANAMKWGAIVDEICKLYPMAKSQTASTKYAISTLDLRTSASVSPLSPSPPRKCSGSTRTSSGSRNTCDKVRCDLCAQRNEVRSSVWTQRIIS